MRCHLLLMALEVFAAPPDMTSLLRRAMTQSVHATGLGLLSSHFPSFLAAFNVQTRAASLLRVHTVLAVVVLSLSIGKGGELEWCKVIRVARYVGSGVCSYHGPAWANRRFVPHNNHAKYTVSLLCKFLHAEEEQLQCHFTCVCATS